MTDEIHDYEDQIDLSEGASVSSSINDMFDNLNSSSKPAKAVAPAVKEEVAEQEILNEADSEPVSESITNFMDDLMKSNKPAAPAVKQVPSDDADFADVVVSKGDTSAGDFLASLTSTFPTQAAPKPKAKPTSDIDLLFAGMNIPSFEKSTAPTTDLATRSQAKAVDPKPEVVADDQAPTLTEQSLEQPEPAEASADVYDSFLARLSATQEDSVLVGMKVLNRQPSVIKKEPSRISRVPAQVKEKLGKFFSASSKGFMLGALALRNSFPTLRIAKGLAVAGFAATVFCGLDYDASKATRDYVSDAASPAIEQAMDKADQLASRASIVMDNSINKLASLFDEETGISHFMKVAYNGNVDEVVSNCSITSDTVAKLDDEAPKTRF